MNAWSGSSGSAPWPVPRGAIRIPWARAYRTAWATSAADPASTTTAGRVSASGGDTVLTGPLPDRAALHGVLAEIEALGLELLEVRRLPPA